MSPASKLMDEVEGIDVDRASNILRSAAELLELERRGKGELSRVGGYVRVTRRDLTMLVVGDLHGDLETLGRILKRAGDRVLERGGLIAFLGDYVDRGPKQLETLLSVLKLKLEYPGNVVALRGNHEPPPRLLPYPHDYPLVLRGMFGPSGDMLYGLSMQVFQLLPHIASTPNGIVLVHGGITSKPHGLEELADPSPKMLEELLWNDPSPMDGVAPSPRGAGVLFGPDVTETFLAVNGASLVVRSHEPCNGYRIDHGGRVVTIFSRLGPPYYNKRAGYMLIPLDVPPSPLEDFLHKI